jgi:hypothetical protein
MRKIRAKRIVVLIIVALAIGYIAWDISQVSPFSGEYSSIPDTYQGKKASYEMTFSKTGRIEIKDTGTGATALKGTVYCVPDSDNSYRVKTHGKTDFIIQPNNEKLSVWLNVLGRQIEDDQEPIPYKVVSFETDQDTLQFNEKGF